MSDSPVVRDWKWAVLATPCEGGVTRVESIHETESEALGALRMTQVQGEAATLYRTAVAVVIDRIEAER